MKSSDIVPNEHYAAHLGGNTYEIAEVLVRARGSLSGTVAVEVIHPEGEADDERYDVRTIETKRVLGPWNNQPQLNTQQTQHVRKVLLEQPRVPGAFEYKTFAEHAADEYAKVVRYNEAAARLTEIGIPREQITWLPRDGSWGGYDPRKVDAVELSHDELAQLLFLVGNRTSAGQTPALAWLTSNFESRAQQPDALGTVIGSYLDLHDEREHAVNQVADPGPVVTHLLHGTELQIYRVVRDA